MEITVEKMLMGQGVSSGNDQEDKERTVSGDLGNKTGKTGKSLGDLGEDFGETTERNMQSKSDSWRNKVEIDKNKHTVDECSKSDVENSGINSINKVETEGVNQEVKVLYY